MAGNVSEVCAALVNSSSSAIAAVSSSSGEGRFPTAAKHMPISSSSTEWCEVSRVVATVREIENLTGRGRKPEDLVSRGDAPSGEFSPSQLKNKPDCGRSLEGFVSRGDAPSGEYSPPRTSKAATAWKTRSFDRYPQVAEKSNAKSRQSGKR